MSFPDFTALATLTPDEVSVLAPPMLAWLAERRQSGGDPDRSAVLAAIEQLLASATPARREELRDLLLSVFPPGFMTRLH